MTRSAFTPCKTRRTAIRRMPWAAIIAKTEGGYTGFESVADYQTWKAQK